jgi:hypothetical protein
MYLGNKKRSCIQEAAVHLNKFQKKKELKQQKQKKIKGKRELCWWVTSTCQKLI